MQGIFLDRDGVINKERADYVKSWQEFVFLPNALLALAELAKLNLPTFIITNQSVIGRDIVSYAAVEKIHQKMLAEIGSVGLHIREIFMCPHQPAAGCTCRKPAPGLLIRAALTYDLDLSQCVFIGDSTTDYEAANNCGCHSVLVRSGRQGLDLEQYLADTLLNPNGDTIALTTIFDDLSAAVSHVMRLNI